MNQPQTSPDDKGEALAKDASPKPSSGAINQPSPPVAKIESHASSSRQWWTRLWLVTALCCALAAVLLVNRLQSRGVTIAVHFKSGYGLKVGDTLRYRGVDIGEVREVALNQSLDGVTVSIDVQKDAAGIAVEGSRFWIERPRIRIGQMAGLDTVLGAKYVGVLPGSAHGKKVSEFTGLETPLSSGEEQAAEVRIRFPAGEGLVVGDPVRYLGTQVGEVTYIELSESLEHVWIGCRLTGTAQHLARAGSQFWIERPRLDVSEVRGLDTLVGGRYVAVEPASQIGDTQHEFIGLAEAPPLRRREGSLEVELAAPKRFGLMRGAPVTYRGLEVGRVADVGLATDGVEVEVNLIVEPEYADLVRDNSVWWSTGGVRFDAGLTGIELTVDSFASWLRGGVAFATPDSPGNKVATGHRFTLAESAEAKWLEWQPRIATGKLGAGAEASASLPRPIRVSAVWESSWLGLKRRKSAQSWALALDGNEVLVPTSIISAATASKSSVTLELLGKSFSLNPATTPSQNGMTRIRLPDDWKLPTWSRDKISSSAWNGKTTLLVINPELKEPLPLDPARVSAAAESTLRIQGDVAIPESLLGSPVLENGSNLVVGILLRDNKNWFIAPIHH